MKMHNFAGYQNLPATELLDKLEVKGRRTACAGKTMRFLRKKAGMSQKQIAEKLKIVQQTYAGYENGQHEPSLDILIQLADFHGVTLDYISGRVFDDWIVEPFFNMKEEEQSQVDILEHAKRQHKDASCFSHMVMEARIHGEYSTYKDTYPTEYRDKLHN